MMLYFSWVYLIDNDEFTHKFFTKSARYLSHIDATQVAYNSTMGAKGNENMFEGMTRSCLQNSRGLEGEDKNVIETN